MPTKQVFIILIILVFILTGGTIAYYLIEDIDLINSFYMTVITVTTVGFKEVKELSVQGKILTIIISLSSFIIIAGMVGVVNYFLFSGEIKKLYRSNKMKNKLSKIKKHYILCGTGEVGEQVIKEFIRNKVNFAAVDMDKDKLEKLSENYKNIPVIWGDATLEDTLKKAGIERAIGMVIALPNDADVLFVTISSRQINPDIKIVAQVTEMNSVEKLKKAGVSNVILSKVIAGIRLSQLILKPNIISFLDVLTHTDQVPLRLEEIRLSKNSPLIDKTLSKAMIPQKTGLMVIAVKDEIKNKYIFNPSASIKLDENIRLIVLGEEEKILNLKNYVIKG